MRDSVGAESQYYMRHVLNMDDGDPDEQSHPRSPSQNIVSLSRMRFASYLTLPEVVRV